MKRRQDNGLTQHATAVAVPLALALAIWAAVVYFLPDGANVPTSIAALAVLILISFYCYPWWLLFSRPHSRYLDAPKVKLVRESDDLIMVDHAPWLGIRVQVSIYVVEGEFERFLDSGFVKNIQQNGVVQIHVPRMTKDRSLFSGIELENILIKPGLYPEGVA